jgi:hypothetical protein
MQPTKILRRTKEIAFLSGASLLLAVFAFPNGLQAGWGDCYDSTTAAARDAISDTQDCTAENHDTAECGSIVYQDDSTGCYTYTDAQAGEGGYWPADDWAEAISYIGDPVAAIHSHNDPDENGYVLSPEDYQFSENYEIPVFLVADGADRSCVSYFDYNSGTGGGYCE